MRRIDAAAQRSFQRSGTATVVQVTPALGLELDGETLMVTEDGAERPPVTPG